MKTREDRWWDTYNAAVAGLSAYSHAEGSFYSVAEVHSMACEQADLAHGPLKTPTSTKRQRAPLAVE